MSLQEKYVTVSRQEVRSVTLCDLCGTEAPLLEPGMYVAVGWYRIGYGMEFADACSSTCAVKVLEKFTPIDPFTMIQEVPPSLRR